MDNGLLEGYLPFLCQEGGLPTSMMVGKGLSEPFFRTYTLGVNDHKKTCFLATRVQDCSLFQSVNIYFLDSGRMYIADALRPGDLRGLHS